MGPVDVNSPTWNVWPPIVYSNATANTSSLFKAWFSEIYPNWLLNENSEEDSFLALSNFSKSIPLFKEVPDKLLLTSLKLRTEKLELLVILSNKLFAVLLSGKTPLLELIKLLLKILY